MPKLVPAEVPEDTRRKAKYLEYVPVVKEFIASNLECAEVRHMEGDEEARFFNNRLRAAIESMGGTEKVGCKVRCVKGTTYLQKVGNENA